MYLQITTKCNMNCEHCGFNCTHEGEHMSFDIFKEALKLDDMCTVGGGEPTLHPEFEKILLHSLGKFDYTFVVTNGTNTSLSLLMLEMSKGMNEKFGVELSMDSFHNTELVDGEVIQAFMEHGRIRDVESSPSGISYNGRAKDYWEKEDCNDYCVCAEHVVKPNGDILFCGCDDAPVIGNVWEGIDEKYQEEEFWDLDERCWTKYLGSKMEEVA